MLRFRLHPTPSGLFFGVAVIALWALLWFWFLYSLGQGSDRQARTSVSPPMAASAVPPSPLRRSARA